MTEKEAESWTSPSPSSAFNFATDIFHLSILALHLGPASSMRSWISNNKTIKHYESQLSTVPEYVRARIEAKTNELKEYKIFLDTILFWKETVMKFADIWEMEIEWLTGLWGGNDAPQIPNEYVASLPEYYVEAPLDFYLFYFGHRPDLLFGRSHSRIIEFSLNLLTHPDYTKNPQIKSKCIELLYYISQNFGSYIGVSFRTELFSNKLATEVLVSAIMAFYVSAESTGAHSQFYDKFNIRYRISYIMKICWADELYRNRIKRVAANKTEFVRFVNMLNNDTTYLLDESLSKLVLIRGLQDEIALESFSKLPQETQAEKQKTLSSYEGQCQSYMQLATVTVEMIGYLTTEIIEPFLVPEIVDRFAAMLNVNLKQLAGPRCQDLKVKNAEKYSFKPKELLYSLLNIYLNLSTKRLFAEAIARDSRSYSKDLFMNAANIMARTGLMSEPNTKRLRDFADLCESVIQEDLQNDEQLGDIPDEFLDPLMYTLMKDPVKLPSGTSIDRATITSHLLSDATDPFNRKPLKITEVVPDVDLKQKIDEWLRSKRL